VSDPSFSRSGRLLGPGWEAQFSTGRFGFANHGFVVFIQYFCSMGWNFQGYCVGYVGIGCYLSLFGTVWTVQPQFCDASPGDVEGPVPPRKDINSGAT
jgi:hypothetical protein